MGLWRVIRGWFITKTSVVGHFHEIKVESWQPRTFLMYVGDELGAREVADKFTAKMGLKVNRDYESLTVFTHPDPKYMKIELIAAKPHCGHEWKFSVLGRRKYGYRCVKCRETKP